MTWNIAATYFRWRLIRAPRIPGHGNLSPHLHTAALLLLSLLFREDGAAHMSEDRVFKQHCFYQDQLTVRELWMLLISRAVNNTSEVRSAYKPPCKVGSSYISSIETVSNDYRFERHFQHYVTSCERWSQCTKSTQNIFSQHEYE